MSLSLLEGEKNIGSASKQTTASKSLIFTELSSLKRSVAIDQLITHAALYQGIGDTLSRVFQARKAITELTSKLAAAADRAYGIHRFDIIGSIGDLVLALPLTRQSESLARFCHALHLSRAGHGDTGRAGALFEQVADDPHSQFRARAMVALGANCWYKSDHQSAMAYYGESLRLMVRDKAFDPATYVMLAKMTAVERGMSGDHLGAVADLENVLPLVRVMAGYFPCAYFDYLNALAVELGEVGRLDEAMRASEIAIASPFVSTYPNWRETFDEIALKQRRAPRCSLAVPARIEPPRSASVPAEPAPALTRKAEGTNVLHLPASQRESAAASVPPLRTKGRVINFQQWKAQTQTPAHLLPGKLSPENKATMTTGEKLIRLMDLISRDETDDEMIDRILDAVEAIVLDGANQRVE